MFDRRIVRACVYQEIYRDEMNIIEINNQSEVGTKVFFTKEFRKKDGKVVSIKFSNNDPTFFVVLCVNKVIFYRIDE